MKFLNNGELYTPIELNEPNLPFFLKPKFTHRKVYTLKKRVVLWLHWACLVLYSCKMCHLKTKQNLDSNHECRERQAKGIKKSAGITTCLWGSLSCLHKCTLRLP